MQDRRAYVKWKEVFLVGHNDLANDTFGRQLFPNPDTITRRAAKERRNNNFPFFGITIPIGIHS